MHHHGILGSRAAGCLAIAAWVSLSACQPPEQATPPPAPPPPPPPSAAPPTASAQPPAAPKPPQPIVVKGVGLQTPESVLHDEATDVYLVSNINGGPLDRDNNGFISRISPDGKVLELKWIEGGQKDVRLSAPKGMALARDRLYVTDISSVRVFDRKTGEPLGRVGVVGATFLNDLTTGPGDRVYFTDTGLKSEEGGLTPTGTDGVWGVEPGLRAKRIALDRKLRNPNGVAADEAGIWVATWGGEFYCVTRKGKREAVQKLPHAELDGLVRLPDGTFLVSSWAAKAVLRGRPGGEFRPVISNLNAPADIGFDAKRNRVLVPLFNEHAVEFHSLQGVLTAAVQTPAAPAGSAPTPAASASPGAQPAASATK